MITRKLVLRAVIAACAIALLAGCTTEEVSQTVPPYATISDEDRNPASAPKPATDDSGGPITAVGDVIMWPFRTIGDAFGSK